MFKKVLAVASSNVMVMINSEIQLERLSSEILAESTAKGKRIKRHSAADFSAVINGMATPIICIINNIVKRKRVLELNICCLNIDKIAHIETFKNKAIPPNNSGSLYAEKSNPTSASTFLFHGKSVPKI